jgi:hypothetical protein
MVTLSTPSPTKVSPQAAAIRFSFVTSCPGRPSRCSRTANALGLSLMAWRASPQALVHQVEVEVVETDTALFVHATHHT